MLALFESIATGYPIGNLVLWRTEQNYPSYPTIGPFEIPQGAAHYPKEYIIDGHQRLAALFGVLHASSTQRSQQWTIYYELENEKFTYTQGKEEATTYYFPLHSLINTWDFLHEREHILEKFKKNADIYIERAEQLAQTFLNYEIPITHISGNLDNAIEIFSRINSRGHALTDQQILHALTDRQAESASKGC